MVVLSNALAVSNDLVFKPTLVKVAVFRAVVKFEDALNAGPLTGTPVTVLAVPSITILIAAPVFLKLLTYL